MAIQMLTDSNGGGRRLGWRMSLALVFVLLAGARELCAGEYPDRFVWIFGWNLSRPQDVTEIEPILRNAAAAGLNGAVVSFGLDTLCKRPPEYFERLQTIRQLCEELNLDLIPAIFSVGYGSILTHNRNLAEGFLVDNALFEVRGTTAHYVPESGAELVNGGFEEFQKNRALGYRFHDQPGEVSFIDTSVFRSGKASLRMENFRANPHGHGRVMQEIKVLPWRCYRVSLWVKTEELQPAGCFQMTVLAGNRNLSPQQFDVSGTQDWRRVALLFNSLELDTVRIYAGVWGGRSGRFWLDDFKLEEVGPINVLHRPGTPVAVKSADGGTTYEEGKDFEPVVDPQLSFGRVDREPLTLRIIPGGRIRPNDRLRVSYYHGLSINRGQVTVCMAEPELYEIFDHEAELLARHLRPRRVLLNMDEIRMGGTCAACRGRNMAKLLGECISKQVAILRRHLPDVEVYIWSDMLDPHHNAHSDYYLVDGDFTGSWNHVPRDLNIAVWGGKPRPESLKFFAEEGFHILIACYYDADDLEDVKGWLTLAKTTPKVRGFMYTPWTKKYGLLTNFGKLLQP